MEETGNGVSQGLAAVRDDVKALRNEHGQALQRVESRLAKVEGGGGASESPAATNPAGRPQQRKTRLRREFPELATLEPAEDDGDVFGDAWPLV